MTKLTISELAERQGVTYAIARGYILYLLKTGKVSFAGNKNPVSLTGKGAPAKVYLFHNNEDCLTKTG